MDTKPAPCRPGNVHDLNLSSGRDDEVESPRLDLALVGGAGDGDGDGLMLSVLDTFTFRAEDRVLTLPGRSQKLLALLALREKPMTRLLVAGMLWPESPEREAASSLRSALWRLKGEAGDALVIEKIDVGLRSSVGVDLREARALARRLLAGSETTLPGDTSTTAVQMLSGELLPGWYDDWVLIEGAEWHQLRLHALEAMASRLTAEGRCADAIQAALATVRVEPLRESAHGALIKSFIAEGNVNEAVKDFYRFRDLLRAELGVDPSPQLTNLVENLHRRRTDR
jgi:DNA-binding SARP family transcriptional activator